MDLLIFDLDGTLIDSKLDLAHAVNATRRHLKLPPLDTELVKTYVGNGAPVLMRRSLPQEFSDEEVQRALEYFLAYYERHDLDYTRPYPGIPDGLEELAGDGVLMAVLTNKPLRMSKGILDGLNLSRYFARIYGGDSFEAKKPHAVGVETLLSELNAAPGNTLFVGDSAIDVQTARNAGIRACGVSYGFQPESFEENPPDMIVDRPEELVRAVIAERKTRGASQS